MKITWSKFAKVKSIQKLPSQKSPFKKEFTPEGFKLRLEKARKIARGVEARSHRGLTQKVESAFKKTINKPIKANQGTKLIKQRTRALTSAFKLSLKRGSAAGERAAVKLGLGKGSLRSGARDRPAKIYKKNFGLSDRESRELGFPPRDPPSEAKKAIFRKQAKLEPVNNPMFVVKDGKMKQIDRFKSVPGTYFRPSTQSFALRKKPKKKK